MSNLAFWVGEGEGLRVNVGLSRLFFRVSLSSLAMLQGPFLEPICCAQRKAVGSMYDCVMRVKRTLGCSVV